MLFSSETKLESVFGQESKWKSGIFVESAQNPSEVISSSATFTEAAD